MKQELIKESVRLRKLAGLVINEDESSDALQQTVESDSYKEFVAQLGKNIKDPKVQALLAAGKEDGVPVDEKIKLVDASIPVQDLRPTQNEVVLTNSLAFPLKNVDSAETCLKGGTVFIRGERIVTADKKYVIDGHHRWSQLFCMNPDASIATTDMEATVKLNPTDFLKITQAAIAADLGDVPTAPGGGINLFTISEDVLKKYVIENITNQVVDVFKKYKKGSTKEEIANYIWKNVEILNKTSKPVPGATEREAMPQTDDAKNWKKITASGELNFMPPFSPQKESVNKRLDNMLKESIIKIK